MHSSHDPESMQAKAGPAGSSAATKPSGRKTSPRSDPRPEDVFARLHRLIAAGKVGAARRLVVEAARRFPRHPRIRLAKRILSDGKATANPWSQETAAAEIAWLDDPPAEARGKWVALIGAELIGMADSAEALVESLAGKKLNQLPVVQYVAS